MIKTNDLRIGNLVYDPFDNIVGIVKIGSEDGVEYIFGKHIDGKGYVQNGLQPIPITEEWLLRFGFEKHKCGISGADMWQGMDGWSIGGGEWLLRGNPKCGLKLVGYYNTDIKYIHQLQNIYYALTGEELKLKETPQ